MNDNFKLLMASDTSLDAQINEKLENFEKSSYADILRFLLKISLVFEAEINVEIYKMQSNESQKS